MYTIYPPSLDLTLAQSDAKAARFLAIKHPGELASLLKADAAKLAKFVAKPYYQVFSIPKPGGARRIIHNPHSDLKTIQQTLNMYLQCAYYQLKPPCAYGFIPRPTDEPKPRNIFTNAMTHLGSEWVLNLDLKDYFHTVTSRHLTWVFRELFGFPEALANQLLALVSYRGVLPMGAPTSPVLSNLAALPLDADLQSFANLLDALYTRFVDDMTFSLEQQPTPEVIAALRQTVEKHQFTLNETKIRLTAKKDHPEVTGLLLKEPHPDVSEHFLKRLKKDIRLYQKLTERSMMERGIFHANVLDKLRRSIAGQVQFVKFIRGRVERELKVWEWAPG
ncbi:MAG: RNA-directed DNA polymerase [Lewinellaceae bacterium]|nr:RNA-directed DNA polymerase [Saprospiraceae bacterium]MCB9338554.1 RNA-directed DNA polymerase [Lewinellaceae bacterium]